MMATDERFDESISNWLEQTAPPRLPERVLEATFERTRRSRQQVGLRGLLGRIRVTRSVFALSGAAVVVVAAALALNFYVNQPGVGGPVPATDPRSAFLGTWSSTSDADGGTQTMTVQVFADDGVEIVVLDDVATVCSGTPSTMTGTGRLEGSTQLVIPFTVYTCDDGSEPETLSGPPLEERLRDWTLVLDPQTDTLSDGFGGLWLREGAELPSPDPAISGQMWPQTSLEEIRRAQVLADAGDPDYTWQVDPQLSSEEWWAYLRGGGAEIVQRFLREELGWDHAQFNAFTENGGGDGVLTRLVYLRCAPGERNPLYPIPGQFDAEGGDRCAPTIDELRYETVSLDLAQLDRRGTDGIWVVNRWAPAAPFAQTDPNAAEAEARALLENFLRARIEGEGAEGQVEVWGPYVLLEVPLMYATTAGAPYERYEIERASDPLWPYGWMEFKVRLFADGGETVVEQQIRWMDTLEHDEKKTTENGQPVPVHYIVFDGEVTVSAADPWQVRVESEMVLDRNGMFGDEYLELSRDPLPVASGCEQGPAPAAAAALARSIQSDPDLEVTAPVAVSVGGADGLVMDVTLASGASVCDDSASPLVLTRRTDGYRGQSRLDQGSRMRLYLLDLPEGLTTRILAIAIVAPEARFEGVIEAATPVVDSIEFQAR